MKSFGKFLFEEIFSIHKISPVSLEITKKAPPVPGTIILSLAEIGLAIVYIELESLAKNVDQ